MTCSTQVKNAPAHIFSKLWVIRPTLFVGITYIQIHSTSSPTHPKLRSSSKRQKMWNLFVPIFIAPRKQYGINKHLLRAGRLTQNELKHIYTEIARYLVEKKKCKNIGGYVWVVNSVIEDPVKNMRVAIDFCVLPIIITRWCGWHFAHIGESGFFIIYLKCLYKKIKLFRVLNSMSSSHYHHLEWRTRRKFTECLLK